MTLTDPRRRIPQVGKILAEPELRGLAAEWGRDQVRLALSDVLEEERAMPSPASALAAGQLAERVRCRLSARLGARTRLVLNATGVFLHTNLGRAPLPPGLVQAQAPLLEASADLELDLGTGRRSQRLDRVGRRIVALTGAEAALAVNNNAAAVLLAVRVLAPGREVIISRGELVEIGGSFRIPDIVEAAGGRLREVGTTNRTRLADYRGAIGEDTGMLLKVHPSNYRVRGFVAEVGAAELAALGAEAKVPVVVDEGSGLLRRRPESPFCDHPSFTELLEVGCDLVCGSGDKLLGGPQCGLIAGRRALVQRLHRDPFFRALRPGRVTLVLLEELLRLHLAGCSLPVDRMFQNEEAQRQRLERVARRLGARIVPIEGHLGGGTAPDHPVPGLGLELAGGGALAEQLRLGDPAVVARVRREAVLLDLRTVDPDSDDELVAAVQAAIRIRAERRADGDGD